MVVHVRKRLARFGLFEFDLETGELRKQGIRIQLQPKPQQLLVALLEQPGAVITRDELRRRLWGDDTFVDYESGLNTTANRLRIKLGDSAENPRYIETLARTGYRFIAPVEKVEWQSENAPQNGAPSIERTEPPGRYRFALLLLAAALVVFIGLAYYSKRPASGTGVRFRQLTFRRGQVSSARFAPGGQNILYTAQWERDPRQLFVTNGSGPESRSLGFSELNLSAVSRNGELALLSADGTMNIAGGTLFRVPLTGSAPSYVDRGIMSAEWTRDGAQLIVVRAINGQNQLEVPAGHVVYRTAGWLSHARVSPGAESVAFIEHPIRHDESGRIMLAEAEHGVRTLSENWLSAVGLAWHPSGKEIWFTAARDERPRSVWAVTPGGRLRPVAQAPGVLTLRDIAPDGRILVTRDTRRLEMAARLAGERDDRDLSWLDWSRVQEVGPDGNLVLFDESGEAASPHSIVYVHHVRERTTTRLGEGIAMAFSPDGQWVLIGTEDHQHLTLVPVKGGAARNLPETGLRYQWAKYFPDGRRILVLASRAQQGLRLYIQPADGSPVLAISPEMMIRNAAISPDGEWVAVLSARNELVLYPAAPGLSPRVIPTTESLAPLRWSADGRWLFVQHLRRAVDATAVVSRVQVGTGRVVAWKQFEPSDRTGVNSITGVALAPDCEGYVYSCRRVLSELFLVEGW